MTLAENVLQYPSVSIVGMAKNAGKTECLNHILRETQSKAYKLGVTSIGVDGESKDIVTETGKPEITLSEGTLFVTSEKHYAMRRMTSEVVDVSPRHTSLGRLVTARVVTGGKIMLSGPPDTATLREVITDLHCRGASTVLIDGALSRLSLSSPAVADAMVLATGAAVAPGISNIVEKTKFVYDLISLEEVDEKSAQSLRHIRSGIWAIDDDDNLHDLGVRTAFMLESAKERFFDYGTKFFVAGAVTDKLLEFLRKQKRCDGTTLIMRDFTRLFSTPQNYRSFIGKGGAIKVVEKNKLLAISINPYSPQGFNVDSGRLKEALEEVVSVPVYNVRQQD